MELRTRRNFLANAALGVTALAGTTVLVARPTGAAASTDNSRDRRGHDDHRPRHHRHGHDHHDDHRHESSN